MSAAKQKKKGLRKVPQPHKITILALKAELLNRAADIHQQVCILPRALVDENGYPRKGTKSVSRKVITTRYPGTLSTTIPNSIQGDKSNTAVVIDGMFLLHTKPLSHHRLMVDYILFLLARWVMPMFAHGKNVHLVFDHPGRHGPSAKDVERQRRDSTGGGHTTCDKQLQLDSPCPTGEAWEQTVACRKCKRALVSLISTGSLLLMQVQALQRDQVFLTAGGLEGALQDQALCVSGGSEVRVMPQFASNHEEADTRVWFHALQFARAMIYSPDTDTFMVGLPLLSVSECKVVVRLDMPGAKDQIYLDMVKLTQMIKYDPDLSTIPAENRASIVQICYAASGCDFTSFFSGVGKATFFSALFRYASFVCSGAGSLQDVDKTCSFLAFLRLVISAYYCKYRSAFNSSPADLFAELSGKGDHTQRHKEFHKAVQRAIWPRATGEEQCLPGWSALENHWQRTAWVVKVWQQANLPNMVTPPLSNHGWSVDSQGSVNVVWASRESIKAVEDLLRSLTSGCRCKTGCLTNRCQCKRSGKLCTFTCRCKQCANTSMEEHLPDQAVHSDSSSASTPSSSSSDESELSDTE